MTTRRATAGTEVSLLFRCLADPDDPLSASLVDCVRERFCGREALRRERDRANEFLREGTCS